MRSDTTQRRPPRRQPSWSSKPRSSRTEWWCVIWPQWS